jgi:hypothetical protein
MQVQGPAGRFSRFQLGPPNILIFIPRKRLHLNEKNTLGTQGTAPAFLAIT